jgi:hypothetical protein
MLISSGFLAMTDSRLATGEMVRPPFRSPRKVLFVAGILPQYYEAAMQQERFCSVKNGLLLYYLLAWLRAIHRDLSVEVYQAAEFNPGMRASTATRCAGVHAARRSRLAITCQAERFLAAIQTLLFLSCMFATCSIRLRP